jgi:hypothetical protein
VWAANEFQPASLCDARNSEICSRCRQLRFLSIPKALAELSRCANIKSYMKQYAKILFTIFTAMICTIGFAADQPACKKSGKNCPMNNGGACNCGKSCDC